jgi:cytochrome c556
MKFAKVLTTAAVAAALTATSAVSAKELFEKADDAINYRQSAFTLIRFQFGDIRAMLKGESPYDQQKMEMRADNLAHLSKFPWEGFIANTAKGEVKVKTAALPGIWKDQADFKKLSKQFQKNAKALAAAVRTGDKGAIKKAVGGVGKTCKGCHDNYKD